jgi:hypothetical protein
MDEKECLIVVSKMKKFLKAEGFNCAGDTATALSNQLYEVLAGAMEEAKRGKVKTIMPRHFS